MKRVLSFVVALALVAGFGANLFAQGDEKAVTDFFMKYRAAYEKSKAVDEILPFWSKARVAEVEKTPKADRGKMFEMMKAFDDASGFKVTKATKVSDTEYSLAVAGTNSEKKPVTGTVSIVKEGGAWKVGKEDYKG
jgi:hypothetical protein